MSKAITHKQLIGIAKMIREWPQDDPLTWENICRGSKIFLGYIPTRQALSGKPVLKIAYKTKQAQRKQEIHKFKHVSKPRTILDAMNKIARLQEDNEQLKTELNKMAELAQRFIYNASIAGLSREKIMAPLPKIHRE